MSGNNTIAIRNRPGRSATSRPCSVSAIICTRNRAAALAKALDHCRRLALPDVDFELAVVDNGSTDTTRAVVSAFASSAPFRVIYVYEPRKGLSWARNRGIRSTSGDVILFTDDDCYVQADWVAAALSIFADDARQVVGGRVRQFNLADLGTTIKTSDAPERLRSAGMLLGFLHGANVAFGRCVVDAIGYFDVRLGAGTRLRSAEDTDFIHRAFKANIAVRYEPALSVDHDHGRSTSAERHALEHGYMIGLGALAGKNLLAGDVGLVKPIYWEIRSFLGRCAKDRAAVAGLVRRLGYFGGAFRFVAQESWRRSQQAVSAPRAGLTGVAARPAQMLAAISSGDDINLASG